MMKVKKILLIVLLLILTAVLVFIVISRYGCETGEEHKSPPELQPSEAQVTFSPKPEDCFTLSFVGDNTIANSNLNSHFDSIVKGDMSYCYKNVRHFFENDEFTFGNLECVLSDSSLGSSSMFHFKAPTKNAEMLRNAGFEYMTLANNHMTDYGSKGVKDTKDTLSAIGIGHAADGEYNLFETKSGLRLGLYCGSQSYMMSAERAASIVSELKASGAELIIFALHWGNEGVYRASGTQKSLAHMYIDAGVDIVYGSHPHVLEPVEEYNGGLIMYSMGNFCFGGNSGPRDMDSAIVQVDVKRASDGSLHICNYRLIPCRISSIASSNDYCPTPYTSGTAEYERTLSKLTGEYSGPDIRPDYSFLNADDKPEPSPEPTSEVTPEPEESGESESIPEPVIESETEDFTPEQGN